MPKLYRININHGSTEIVFGTFDPMPPTRATLTLIPSGAGVIRSLQASDGSLEWLGGIDLIELGSSKLCEILNCLERAGFRKFESRSAAVRLIH